MSDHPIRFRSRAVELRIHDSPGPVSPEPVMLRVGGECAWMNIAEAEELHAALTKVLEDLAAWRRLYG